MRKPPDTYPETRQRLHAAILTVTVAHGGRDSSLTSWPDTLIEHGEWWEIVLQECRTGLWRPPARLRFQPSRDEIDDCLYALAWLRPTDSFPPLERWEWPALNRRAWQELVYAHNGPRASWPDLARYMTEEHDRPARSREWWRGWHNDLVARAFDTALADLRISGQKSPSIGGARARSRAA